MAADQRSRSALGVRRVRTHAAVLAALALGIYANTLTLQYALDDHVVILENQFTRRGVAGIKDILTHGVTTGYFGREMENATGGRYRPLSLVTHAVEYQLFGLAPAVSHFINVVCYAVTVLLLFLLLVRLFPAGADSPWYRSVPFLAAALFAAHPVHTEVVANIKGRDDVLGLLFGLGALLSWSSYVGSGRRGAIAWACVLFFLSLMSKESSISFIAVAALILWYFERKSLSEIAKLTAPLVAVAVLYVAVRAALIGVGKQSLDTLMADPFLGATAPQRAGTVALIWLLYLKLLLFPHPLTHDYYPYHVHLIQLTNPLAIISLGVHAILAYVAVMGFRRRSVISFCIATYFATMILYGNVLFDIGVFMNERFLYVSSAAFALLAAWLLTRMVTRKAVVVVVSVVLLAAGSVKTMARNRAWYDDTTLALTDVQTSSDSARAQMAAGSAYVNLAIDETNPHERERELKQSIEHLQAALRIHPRYFDAARLLGRALTESGRYSSALDVYKQCLDANPDDPATIDGLEILAQRAAAGGELATAASAYDVLIQRRPSADVYAAAGELYGRHIGDLQKAREYLEQAVRMRPRSAPILVKLGVVHAMTGDMAGALDLFDQAIAVDPSDAAAYLNKGRALRQMGRDAEGDELMRKALQMNPRLAGR